MQTPSVPPKTPLWMRTLNWLADRDAAYRQRRHLEEMSPEHLADMGYDPDAAFYRRRASRKADAVPPSVLNAARFL